MARYKLVWFDDGKYHTKNFNAETDKEAIEFSKTYDIGLGSCFDVYKNKELIFNDDMWDTEAE